MYKLIVVWRDEPLDAQNPGLPRSGSFYQRRLSYVNLVCPEIEMSYTTVGDSDKPAATQAREWLSRFDRECWFYGFRAREFCQQLAGELLLSRLSGGEGQWLFAPPAENLESYLWPGGSSSGLDFDETLQRWGVEPFDLLDPAPAHLTNELSAAVTLATRLGLLTP